MTRHQDLPPSMNAEQWETTFSLVNNAYSALKRRYAETWPGEHVAYVVLHYVYGLTDTLLSPEAAHEHLATVTKIAELHLASSDVDRALRMKPEGIDTNLIAIADVVEGYGRRDAGLINARSTSVDEGIFIEPQASPQLNNENRRMA